MKIVGGAELDRILTSLPTAVYKSYLRKALRGGCKVIKAEADRRVDVGSQKWADFHAGQTKKAIKVRAAKKRKRSELRYEVRLGKGDFAGDTFYAAMKELGHIVGKRRDGKPLHVQTASGDWVTLTPGMYVSPRPWLRPAFDATKEAATATVADILRQLVEKHRGDVSEED